MSKPLRQMMIARKISLFVCSGIALTLLDCAGAAAQDRLEMTKAIGNEDVEAIQRIADKRPQILDAILNSQSTPLQIAIRTKKLQSVKALIEAGARTDSNNRQKMSALHFAIRNSSPEIKRFLAGKQPELDARDRSGSTPLMYVVRFRKNPLSLAKSLIARGADLNAVNASKQTALHMACYNNWFQAVEMLVEAEADLTVRDREENTPLHAAALACPAAIPLLIEKGADVQAINKRGQSILHLACQGNQVESLKHVIDRFQDVNRTDQSGMTPLSVAMYRIYNPTAPTDIVDMLLKKGADPNGSINNSTNLEAPILVACRKGHLQLAEKLLQAGAKIDSVNQRGDGCLHLAAAAEGNFFVGNKREKSQALSFAKLIQLLIEKGADRRRQNNQGKTPLAYAVEQNFLEAIELLIDRNHTLDKILPEENPLHWAAKRGLLNTVKVLTSDTTSRLNERNTNGQTALMIASRAGQPKIVSHLLSNGADVSIQDNDGFTALLDGAEGGSAEVVRLLTNAGADVEHSDSSGQKPLHLAAWGGFDESVEILLRYCELDQQATPSGNTPLHAAAWQGHASVVQKLLSAGANPNARDSDGWSPLHKAAFRGHLSTVTYLLRNGADIESKNGIGQTPFDLAFGQKKKKVVEAIKSFR